MFYTLIKQWVCDHSERALGPIDIIINSNSVFTFKRPFTQLLLLECVPKIHKQCLHFQGSGILPLYMYLVKGLTYDLF